MSSKDSNLKTWLEAQGFSKFENELRESGVETLDDLKVLKTEDEVMELAGSDGINMGVVYRRKFVKAVLELQGIKSTTDDNKLESTEDEKPSQDNKNNNANNTANANNAKVMSKKEEKALTDLVQTIKSHTAKLKKTKEELAKIQKQSEDSRNEIISTFDKAMGTLLSRRKNLEQMVQVSGDDCTKKLTTQIDELQASAKKLLLCQKDLQNKFRDTQQSSDRETGVINNVVQALNEIPKSDIGSIDIAYTQGEPELNAFIENYGSIAIGKKKTKSAANPADNQAQTTPADA